MTSRTRRKRPGDNSWWMARCRPTPWLSSVASFCRSRCGYEGQTKRPIDQGQFGLAGDPCYTLERQGPMLEKHLLFRGQPPVDRESARWMYQLFPHPPLAVIHSRPLGNGPGVGRDARRSATDGALGFAAQSTVHPTLTIGPAVMQAIGSLVCRERPQGDGAPGRTV